MRLFDRPRLSIVREPTIDQEPISRHFHGEAERPAVFAEAAQASKRRDILMTITVKVGEAKTHLSDLLAKVEAGEEVIIARGNDPIARLTRVRREGDVRAVIAEIRAARADLPKTTVDELLAWRDEGRRV